MAVTIAQLLDRVNAGEFDRKIREQETFGHAPSEFTDATGDASPGYDASLDLSQDFREIEEGDWDDDMPQALEARATLLQIAYLLEGSSDQELMDLIQIVTEDRLVVVPLADTRN